MKNIEFDEEKIKMAINKKAELLSLNEPVTLIEGFSFQSIQPIWNENAPIGGPSIPTILLVGNNSGRVYTFAYRFFFPNE